MSPLELDLIGKVTDSYTKRHNLIMRLKSLCDEAEGLAKGEDGEQLKAMVFTKQIRKILAESS